MDRPPLDIAFVSDVACPWCAIGLASFEQALARLGSEVAVQLHFEPFELNPDMPPEGAETVAYLMRKYGRTAEQVAQAQARIRERGAAVGFSFAVRRHVWNTFNAHRVLHWAGLEGRAVELKRALLRAYHGEGRNPGAPDVLAELAGAAGLDAARARELGGKPQGKGIIDYITVLKPRETVLLAFIGVCSAIVAAQGHPALDVLALALVTIALGSAGANALTNYLDRNVDARMQRTHLRALPAKRIVPAKRALVWSIFLIIAALGLAWYLDPLCFVFGLVGTIAASVFRKKVMCVIQGGIAGCAPVLIGYVAVTHQLYITILFMCILIAVWIALHVWSLMIANREDYLQAGVAYFPVSWKVRDAIKVLVMLSVLLYAPTW